MSFWSFDSLPGWAMLLSLASHLAAGLGLGICYFHTVWWNTRLFASGGRATTAIASMFGRFAVLGGLLAMASFEGAPPLLMTALGVLIARSAVMRRLREAAP